MPATGPPKAAALLMNNLDPEVAENPNELVADGGNGRAARTWNDFDRIAATLKTPATRRCLCSPASRSAYLHSCRCAARG